MISPNCDYCKSELEDFGAILLSPPNGLIVNKFHICKDCYEKIKPEEIGFESEKPLPPPSQLIKEGEDPKPRPRQTIPTSKDTPTPSTKTGR